MLPSGSIDLRNIEMVCRASGALDRTLFRELVDTFLRENGRRVDACAVAVRTGHRPTLQQLTHALAGSAAMFGATTLHALARRLEREVASEPWDRLSASVESVHAEFDAVTRHLQELEAARDGL